MEREFVAIIVTTLVVSMVMMVVKCILKRSNKQVVTQNVESPTINGLYRFTVVEIENALKIGNMRRRKWIAHGRRGEFYQGILPSGQGVAIKEMHKTKDAIDSFNREVECLSRARHPIIV